MKTLTVDDINKYYSNPQIIASTEYGMKILMTPNTGVIRVQYNDTLLFEGYSQEEAIQVYNTHGKIVNLIKRIKFNEWSWILGILTKYKDTPEATIWYNYILSIKDINDMPTKV